MKWNNFLLGFMFVWLFFSLTSCEKLEELLKDEEEEELDLMDNEAVTNELNGGIWYKYPNLTYLFRKNKTMVSSWYDLEEDPTDPSDMLVGTNAYPYWEVKDGYLYFFEDMTGSIYLDDLFEFYNGIAGLKRMYDPYEDKGTLEVPALTGQVWSGNYLLVDMNGDINTSLQFFEDGTALRVDTVYADLYNIERLDRYEYRWEVINNVIQLSGGDGGYGVALPDDPRIETNDHKAIYLDFENVGSPYVNF